MIKGRYETLEAFGVVDLGLDWKEQGGASRYALLRLDENHDGILSEDEKVAVKSTLYTLGVEAGAGVLKEGMKVVSLDSCLDFSKGGALAVNDSVHVFNKEEHIMLTTHYIDSNLDEYTTTTEGLTNMSFELVKLLEKHDLIG